MTAVLTRGAQHHMPSVCPSCGCSQPDGLLCTDDTAALRTMLAAAPQLLQQLDVAIAKQAKLGSGGKAGKGSAHERSPVNWGMVSVRDALLVEVAIWGDDVPAIRRHPNAGKAVAGIARVVKNAYRAIDRAKDQHYLGVCLAEQGDTVCDAELWIKPGAHQVECGRCDTVRDVLERRRWLLLQAEDMIFTPREASQYVGDIGGITVGQQRIRNYVERGRIARRPAPDDAMRLRFGDLLEVLRDEAERKEQRAAHAG